MAATVPQTFTAWRFQRQGIPSKSLQLDKDVPLRALKDGEVILKPSAAALNPVDWKIILLIPGFLQPFPVTAGADVAGTVISSKHPKWKEGDQVFGQVTPAKTPFNPVGAIATFTIANGDGLMKVPQQYEGKWTDVVGLPLVGLTALTLALRVKEGDRVLVVGGSTSVALVLSQMLKSKQKAAFVASIANGKKEETLKGLGVDTVIDYKSQDPVQILKKDYALGSGKEFDIILDCVGNHNVYKASEFYLKKEGSLVVVGASGITSDGGFLSLLKSKILPSLDRLRPRFLGGVSRKIEDTFLDGSVKNYDTFQSWVADGTIKPITDRVFPFDQTVEAYEELTKNGTSGKLVVDVSTAA